MTITRAGGGGHRWRREAAAIVVAATFLPSVAAAGIATIDAIGGPPLPPGAAIAVVAADPDARMNVLLPAVAAALAAQGIRIDEAAPLRLTLVATVASVAADRGPFRLHGTIGSSSRPDVSLEVPLPAWPGPERRDPQFRYSVAMTLAAAGAPPLWQGSAAAMRPSGDDLKAQEALAVRLAERIGQSATRAVVPLD
jgi:hypothetical protein